MAPERPRESTTLIRITDQGFRIWQAQHVTGMARDSLWRGRLAGVLAPWGSRKNRRRDAGATKNRRSLLGRWVGFHRSGMLQDSGSNIGKISGGKKSGARKESVRRGSLTQVAHRVDRRAIDADFVVYVRTGGSPAYADISNRVAAPQLLPYENIEAR
jgi:hypothetical protein